jgi:PilZ domain
MANSSVTLNSTPTDVNTDAQADSVAPALPIMQFDRRRYPRHEITGHVTLMRRSHDTDVYRHPVCSIRLHDMSEGGLGGGIDIPLQPDEPVAILFPPHGADHGMDLHGHVVRCIPGDGDEAGYNLGIVFDAMQAA